MENLDSTITKDFIVTFLREHKDELFERFGVSKIALFGSFARDEQTKESDVDVLFDTDKMTFDNYIELRKYLEENFERKVDLGTFNSLRSHILRSIKEDIIYA